jgi:GNAT superfamily N-acetyltransferase
MTLAYHHFTGTAAQSEVLREEYARLYMDIRTEPPYSSGPLYRQDRFLERTVTQAEHPGFALVSARDGERLAGFAFGLPFAAGRWWGGEATPGPRDVVAATKFAVIELNLLPEYRGKGHGRRLLNELLAERPEPYAILLSHPDAKAHAMYEHWGWRVVGTVRPIPEAEVSDAMMFSLR